jgi:hypothetical protein
MVSAWQRSASQSTFAHAHVACADTWKWTCKQRPQWSGWLLLLMTELHQWRTPAAAHMCVRCDVQDSAAHWMVCPQLAAARRAMALELAAIIIDDEEHGSLSLRATVSRWRMLRSDDDDDDLSAHSLLRTVGVCAADDDGRVAMFGVLEHQRAVDALRKCGVHGDDRDYMITRWRVFLLYKWMLIHHQRHRLSGVDRDAAHHVRKRRRLASPDEHDSSDSSDEEKEEEEEEIGRDDNVDDADDDDINLPEPRDCGSDGDRSLRRSARRASMIMTMVGESKRA